MKRCKANLDAKLKINILSDVDAAYIAGLVDGEGSIALKRSGEWNKNRTLTYRLSVTITNTFPGIMGWIALKVGYGAIYKQKTRNNWKDAWHWQINGRRAMDLLKQLYPYLKIKKLQVEVALVFGETVPQLGGVKLSEKVLNFRQELKNRMTALNKKG